MSDYRQSYAVAPDLTEEDLALTARADLALRSMITDHRLSALTYQFMAFGEDERTQTLLFVAASRLPYNVHAPHFTVYFRTLLYDADSLSRALEIFKGPSRRPSDTISSLVTA